MGVLAVFPLYYQRTGIVRSAGGVCSAITRRGVARICRQHVDQRRDPDAHKLDTFTAEQRKVVFHVGLIVVKQIALNVRLPRLTQKRE